MRVLDTHFHIWDQRTIDYPWVSVAREQGLHFVSGQLPSTVLQNDYEAGWGALGFVPFVHVEAGAVPDAALAETVWVAEQIPSALLVVFADLTSPALDETLATHRNASATVVGVRQIVTHSDDSRLSFTDHDLLKNHWWVRGLSTLEKSGLSFDLQIYPHQARTAAVVFGPREGLRVIVNHGLLPDLGDLRSWRAGLRELSRLPSIAIKVGGLSMRNREWDVADAVTVLENTIDLFGIHRTMIGTNAPVETSPDARRKFADAISRVLENLNSDEQHALLEGTAQAWYRVSA